MTGNAPKNGLRILVVEDEVLISMMLQDMLRELGHTCPHAVGRFEEALKLARSGDFDLAILDVNIRGQSTYPVADIIAERGVPFIFATGYGLTGINPAYQSTPVLQKPFDLPSLAQMIATARSRSQ